MPANFRYILQVRNLGTDQCLDTLAHNDPGGEPGLYMCHGMGNNQVKQRGPELAEHAGICVR